MIYIKDRHEYLLRIDKNLWNKIVNEADSRGLKVIEMIIELLEIGILTLQEREVKNGKIKFK